MSKIKIENLHKSFGKKVILDGIYLDVSDKESLVIIGGSGTGKSVLIKSIIQLIKPDEGKIFINDKNILEIQNEEEKNKILSKFGFLFQNSALFDSLKVWENVAFKLIKLLNYKKNDAKEIAIEKLKVVGLNSDVANLYPIELSGGMQKRVSLARTICTNPEIIFFDEPTTGLDPIMSDVINDLIIKSSKSVNATTITISHDMNSVKKIADKVALLYKGKIAWLGSVEEMERTKNIYINQFINGKIDGPMKFF